MICDLLLECLKTIKVITKLFLNISLHCTRTIRCRVREPLPLQCLFNHHSTIDRFMYKLDTPHYHVRISLKNKHK